MTTQPETPRVPKGGERPANQGVFARVRLRAGRFSKRRLAALAVAVVAVLIGVGLAFARNRKPDPVALFEAADQDYKAKRFPDAWSKLERLGRLRPPSSIDRFLRAAVLFGLERLDQGLAELALIPDDHPLAPLARLTTGQVEIHRFRARPAEKALLESLRLFPIGVQPRKELAYIYNIQRRQAELDDQLARLLDQDAIGFQQILHWTKTRNTPWNPEGDLGVLEKLATSDPDDRRSRLAFIQALVRTTRQDLAKSMLETLDAADPEVRALKIELLLELGDVVQAEALLDSSVGDYYKLEVLRGRLALKRGDAAGAERAFRKALAGDPYDRATLHGLATALKLGGGPRQAEPYLAAARRHDALWELVAQASTGPGESIPDLPRRIGLACQSIGRLAEARAWLSLAIKRDPLDSQSQRALYELRGPHDAQPTGERPRELAGRP